MGAIVEHNRLTDTPIRPGLPTPGRVVPPDPAPGTQAALDLGVARVQAMGERVLAQGAEPRKRTSVMARPGGEPIGSALATRLPGLKPDSLPSLAHTAPEISVASTPPAEFTQTPVAKLSASAAQLLDKQLTAQYLRFSHDHVPILMNHLAQPEASAAEGTGSAPASMRRHPSQLRADVQIAPVRQNLQQATEAAEQNLAAGRQEYVQQQDQVAEALAHQAPGFAEPVAPQVQASLQRLATVLVADPTMKSLPKVASMEAISRATALASA
jgi:hypothetical protein